MSSRLLVLLSLLVILAYLSPLLFLGEHANVTISDNLDGAFVSLKLLVESGQILAPPTATIANIMNGAPRASFPGELNVMVWLFYFLGPFGAYVLNQALIRLVAFCGMYLLLSSHLLSGDKNRIVVFGVALNFALLPYYALFGLSIAGQPLVLYAYLNIRRQYADWKDWLIIALVSFYSIFIISYAFFICAIGGLLIHDWWRRGKVNRVFAGAIALMFVLFFVTDYRLLVAVLSPAAGFVSHRAEFTMLVDFSLSDALISAKNDFIYGLSHAASAHHIIILPTIAIAAGVIAVRREKVPLFFAILVASALISLWHGFYILLLAEVQAIFHGIPAVNLDRFYFLHPLLWYVLFALALQAIGRHLRFGPTLVALALVAQIAFLFHRSDHATERRLGNPTYAEFFSTRLFADIDRFIGEKKETYRVVSIGMHPSISQYNGYYALDGYLSMYPLAYKHQFRQLIAGELEKSSWARTYFDGWGSRAYVMASELENYPPLFMLTGKRVRTKDIHINRLDFNTIAFKAMGGKYVFSAVEVRNSAEIGLRLLKIFARDDSPWEVYVYQAI